MCIDGQAGVRQELPWTIMFADDIVIYGETRFKSIRQQEKKSACELFQTERRTDCSKEKFYYSVKL